MQSWAVLILAALLCAAASAFVLRAYRRAGLAEGAGAEARPAPALIACGMGAVLALAGYLFIGRPDLPDQPYAARMEALRERAPESFTIDEALAVLGQAARAHPDDPQPHAFIGGILLDTGRPQDAARAFDAALRRDPDFAPALLGLARAMVQVEEGRVSPEAQALFAAASQQLPDDPAPWIYQAMAAMQAGDDAGAQTAWGQAFQRMSEDDPRREMALRMSRGEAMLDVDPER